uniref:Uncharacterized protein n=1 Tax=Amphimedon queenslandica TaxID=400682 RepID=A0A1X7VG07_AMPQE
MAERKRYLCVHCDQFLSRSFYYSHRRFYYNHERKQWSKTERICLSENVHDGDLELTLDDSCCSMQLGAGDDVKDNVDIENDFCFEDDENKNDSDSVVYHDDEVDAISDTVLDAIEEDKADAVEVLNDISFDDLSDDETQDLYQPSFAVTYPLLKLHVFYAYVSNYI